MKTIKLNEISVTDFFAKIEGLERIYTSEKDLGLFLWRAYRSDEPNENPLHPDYVSRQLKNGVIRNPDVTVEQRNGVECIIPVVYQKRKNDIWKAQGTSLFDRPNTFKGKRWEYFKIPKGTTIPRGLLIIEDDFNSNFDSVHYSIVPDHVMTLDNFKLLIEQLLINIEMQRGKTNHA